MRPIIATIALAALAACQPSADDPPAGPDPSATVATDAAAAVPASLAGEYRVAGIDGTEVAGQIGIALSITRDTMFYDPRCAGFSWSYTYDGGALATARPADAPVCEIAVDPELQRLAAALDAVTGAARTPSNAIELSGGGHSVTLYSQ